MSYWIDNADSYLCSNCGFEVNNPNKYLGGSECPHCHAKMDNPHRFISYSDVENAKDTMNRAESLFKSTYKKYLTDSLHLVEMEGKLVFSKSLNLPGVLKIDQSSYGSLTSPYEIKFYPITKKGAVSKNSRYVSGLLFHGKDLVDTLRELFEVVGDYDE